MTALTGDLAQLHPTFRARLQAVADETGIALSVTSGGRTHAEQQALWDGYANRLSWRGGGHMNDPANPYRGYNSANRPGTSRHEQQDDGWAYAADLAPAPGSSSTLRAALARHSLVLPYSTEPWHVEPVEARLPAAPTDEDEAMTLPTITPGHDSGHPKTEQLFCDLVNRINPARALTMHPSAAAARELACRELQAFFRLPGSVKADGTGDGICGTGTWRLLLAAASGFGK